MTQLHWEKHNHFAHYGKPGLNMLGYDPKYDLAAQGYQPLSFDFDSHAENRLTSALNEQLPALVRDGFPDGVTVNGLFSQITNQTPATKKQLRTIIQNLSRNREVELLDSEGKLRSRGAIPEGTDLIRVGRQLLLLGHE